MTFKFTSPNHDVYEFPDKAAFDQCDFSGAVLLSNPNEDSYELTVLDGTNFYGCSKTMHCIGGQKIEITDSANSAGTATVGLAASLLAVAVTGTLCRR